ncbi:MAG: YcxB family protein [Pseudomonadota bacterium]
MTFEDHITADHYREMARLANPLNSKWALWAVTAILWLVGLSVLAAMGLFFYSAGLVVVRRGVLDAFADPTILLLICSGLLLSLGAGFVMAYKRAALKFFWSFRRTPDISDMDLREGLNLGPARYTLSDQGIKVEMALDTDEIRWTAFAHFRETANGIMLMLNRTNGMVVPTGGLLASGDYEAARDIVFAHVKRAG